MLLTKTDKSEFHAAPDTVERVTVIPARKGSKDEDTYEVSFISGTNVVVDKASGDALAARLSPEK